LVATKNRELSEKKLKLQQVIKGATPYLFLPPVSLPTLKLIPQEIPGTLPPRSNINLFQVWLDKVLQVVQGVPHEYTPQKPYPQHIFNYEVQDGCEYKVVKDRLEPYEVVQEGKLIVIV
jgi:hypothetical protein